MRNAGLDEAQAGIKIARRNINNLKYADDTNLVAESKEELKSLMKKVKEEAEKAGLKLNIQKTNQIPPSLRVFSNESTLCMRWPNTGVSALASFLPKNTQG